MHDCIIGNDLLRRYHYEIRLQERDPDVHVLVLSCFPLPLRMYPVGMVDPVTSSMATKSVPSVMDPVVKIRNAVSIRVAPRSEFLFTGRIAGSDFLFDDNESFLFHPTYVHPFIKLASSLVTITSGGIIQLRGVNLANIHVYIPITKVMGELYRVANIVDFDLTSLEILASSSVSSDVSSKASQLPPDFSSLTCNVPGLELPSTLTPLQRYQLIKLINEYSTIFAKDKYDLGRTNLAEHTIDTGDALPIKQRVRPMSQAQEEAARAEVDRMRKLGIVRDSNSPWSSCIVLVKKPDGTWRFCIDYRALNSVTKKDSYPLPNINITLNRLKGAKFFSTLDFASGYWQIGLAEADREKTAFSLPWGGLLEWLVMPFGLTNAPPTFQRTMNLLLSGLPFHTCMVYIDDIIILGSTFESHLFNLRLVFDRIKESGMKLKIAKCHFCTSKVTFLGHSVSAEGIQPNPKRVEMIAKMPRPRTRKDFPFYA